MDEKEAEKLYQQLAATRHQELNAQMAQVAKANPEFTVIATETAYECSGEIQISSVLVRCGVELSLTFPTVNDQCISISGSGWGIGLGASGTSRGQGVFNVSPNYLLEQAEVKYAISFFTAGIAGVEITFWNSTGTTYWGVFVAPMLAIGAGTSTGEGKFISC